MSNIADSLAEFITTVHYADLPSEVLQDARRSLIDTIGVAWAAASQSSSRSIHDLMVSLGGNPDSTTWAFGTKLPATSAVFLNGVMAAALDFDSLNEDAITHSDIVTVPVVLALGERQRSSGREILEALVIGNEILGRMAKSTRAHRGWFYTSLHGVFAAAAVAAKLLRLDKMKTRHALGIALSQAAGTQQAIIERTLMKRVQSALAAQAGVFSAFLAQSGITAPSRMIDGQYGLYAMYENGDSSAILDGLGVRFAAPPTTIKKYPCCACNHAAIEASLALVGDIGHSADDITDISVTLTPYMNRLVGADFIVGDDDPQIAAQFSVQYAVACAILRKRFTVDDIRDEAVRDPEIASVARKVEVIVNPDLSGLLGPAEVSITRRDRSPIVRRVDTVPGTPSCPLSEQELLDKFLSCMSGGSIAGSRIDAQKLFSRINAVADLEDVSTLFNPEIIGRIS